jgi:hypothetical protein
MAGRSSRLGAACGSKLLQKCYSVDRSCNLWYRLSVQSNRRSSPLKNDAGLTRILAMTLRLSGSGAHNVLKVEMTASRATRLAGFRSNR